MIFLSQLVLAILILALEIGPLGRQSGTAGLPALSIIIAWAFTWFGDRKIGLSWAVIYGGLMELIGFFPLGIWLAIYVGVVLLIDYLKNHFFEISSILLALAMLAIVALLASLVIALVTQTFDWYLILTNGLATVMVGGLLYLVLATRFRFIARWTGRRIAQ